MEEQDGCFRRSRADPTVAFRCPSEKGKTAVPFRLSDFRSVRKMENGVVDFGQKQPENVSILHENFDQNPEKTNRLTIDFLQRLCYTIINMVG